MTKQVFSFGDTVRFVKPVLGDLKNHRFMNKTGTVVAVLGSNWYDVRMDDPNETEPYPCPARELEKVE